MVARAIGWFFSDIIYLLAVLNYFRHLSSEISGGAFFAGELD